MSLAAAVTLALGIGLATAVFTVAEAVLLRRFPFSDQDRLYVLFAAAKDGSVASYPLGREEALGFLGQARSLEASALYAYWGASPAQVENGEAIARLDRALVSGTFFDVLGVDPLIGRTLAPEDDIFGAPPVAVLSQGAWRRRFGGDPAVLGQTVVTYEDSVAYTIVGVMPPGVDFPRGTDFWAPVAASTPPERMDFVAFNVLGRLAHGAAGTQAESELTAFLGRPEGTPWLRDFRGAGVTLPDLLLGDTRQAVVVFAAAAGLLLLITCINVGTLLLVRGMGRGREIAIRTALGATRRRLIRQLLGENTVLAAVGGVLGLVLAALGVQAFVALAPADIPRLDRIGIDLAALAGAVGITTIGLVLFGVMPALLTSRVDAVRALRSGATVRVGRHAYRHIEGLVAGQVAIAFVVLSAAGLLAKSFVRLQGAELAFEPSRLLIAELALKRDTYRDQDAQLRLLKTLLPALTTLPGVEAVSPTVAVPFSGAAGWDGRFAAEGQTEAEAAGSPLLNMELVTPDYFATLGVPLLRGRGFTDADREGAPRVIVLSQSAARHYWPNADPIGEHLLAGAELQHMLTVVGLVPDTRYRSLHDARPSVYFPLAQSFFPFTPTTLAIRTAGPPGDMVTAVRRTIAATGPGVALEGAAPFEVFLAGSLAHPRLNALLLAVFAVAALVLAAVGLFGVMMTTVRQRRRELGIRLALGATSHGLGWLVLRQGLRIAATGLAVGLLLAFVAHRLLLTLLYDVRPADAATLLAAAGLLGLTTVVAGLVPVRSTVSVDPMATLKGDG